MNETLEEIVPGKKRVFSLKRVSIALGSVFAIFLLISGGMVVYAKQYDGRVLPGVSIGSIPIGGLTETELKQLLQDLHDKLLEEEIPFAIQTKDGEKEFFIYPIHLTDTNEAELVEVDIAVEVDFFMGLGKQGNIFARTWTVVQSTFGGKESRLISVAVDREKIEEIIATSIEPYETKATDARVVVETFDPFVASISPESSGVTFVYNTVADDIAHAWSTLTAPSLGVLPQVTEEPSVTKADIAAEQSKLEQVFISGPLVLTYVDPITTRTRNWTLSKQRLADLLTIVPSLAQENARVFGLSVASTTAYLEETVVPAVTIDAQNAKFELDTTGKVVAFQGARQGVTLDTEQTLAAMQQVMAERTWRTEPVTTTVSLITKTTEPSVQTSDINSLGISDVLGVGISSFKGSPANRVKNIRNAVNKLNGILIPPGEEFSTIQYTQPYTLEGGYLPELVIKGDEIKPEIGGGLCQIGTTLFRMAMNSGLDITERRNHSLVVNYYNDPSNGLPGTDATIYEPSPNFRFKNDTAHHILIQTVIDESTQELIFTVWGTKDGRTASYTPPVVSRWISPGATKIVETTKLTPGTRQCQHAYRGADASFTYTRILADGTKEEELFESHYRPLPEICLVGVAALPEATPPCPEGEICEPAAPIEQSSVTPPVEEVGVPLEG